MKKYLLLLLLPLVAFATPVTVNRLDNNHIEPLVRTDFIKGSYFTATSTNGNGYSFTATSGGVGYGFDSSADITFQDYNSDGTLIGLSSGSDNVFTIFHAGGGTSGEERFNVSQLTNPRTFFFPDISGTAGVGVSTSTNSLTYWGSDSGLHSTTSPTVGYITATSTTDTSSFAGGIYIPYTKTLCFGGTLFPCISSDSGANLLIAALGGAIDLNATQIYVNGPIQDETHGTQLYLQSNRADLSVTMGGGPIALYNNADMADTGVVIGRQSTTTQSMLEVNGITTSDTFNATSTTATSTAANGWDISGGCFAINGICISGAAGGSGTVSSGPAGYLGYYNATGNTISATGTNPLYVDAISATSTSVTSNFRGPVKVNNNSTTGFFVEQDGVNDNTFIVDTTNGVVAMGTTANTNILQNMAVTNKARLISGTLTQNTRAVNNNLFLGSLTSSWTGAGGSGGTGLNITVNDGRTINAAGTNSVTGGTVAVTRSSGFTNSAAVFDSITGLQFTATDQGNYNLSVNATNTTTNFKVQMTVNPNSISTSGGSFYYNTYGVNIGGQITFPAPTGNFIQNTAGFAMTASVNNAGTGQFAAFYNASGGSDTDWFLYNDRTTSASYMGGDGSKTYWGTGGNTLDMSLFMGGGAGNGDASINYDGTNLVINPQEIGSGATVFSNGSVGIGTTTPFAMLAVNPTAGTASNQFVVGSSTATAFLIDNSGRVGIGTTSPMSTFNVESKSGTTTVTLGSSTKPWCENRYAIGGAVYSYYLDSAGTLVQEAGACK